MDTDRVRRESASAPGWKLIPTSMVFGLIGFGIAVFVDMVLFIMVANTPEDEQLMSEDMAIGLLVGVPIVGAAVGVLLGVNDWWTRHHGGTGG